MATNAPVTPRHQRTKSASVLRSFMKHRRNGSDGDGLTPAALSPIRGPGPLEELSHNRQQAPLGAPQLHFSPHKNTKHYGNAVAVSPGKPVRTVDARGHVDSENSPLPLPTPSPKKATFVSLLSRPKSHRNLSKPDGSPERGKGRLLTKDKENCIPLAPAVRDEPANTPIYAQFCSTSTGDASAGTLAGTATADRGRSTTTGRGRPVDDGVAARGRQKNNSTRPKSFHPSQTSPTSESAEPGMDLKDIDSHLEALLDRRNIPENQRYKMRSLAKTIKMEFIRQDWAEHQAQRPPSHESLRPSQTTGAGAASAAPTKSKHSRVKSLSRVARGRSRDRGDEEAVLGTRRHKSPGLSLRKKAEGTLGRHLRSKSTENIAGAAGTGLVDPAAGATTTAAGGNALAGLFAPKTPQQRTPGDFVQYLRRVPEPERVEVGKLHKLRLLLRNETVAWTEDFIGQGGMEETVGLLYRILAIEWREEHEDTLLHENLLCLKALCTTALALEYLHAHQATLLPALIHMIFDPEKKGPSEFTTRNIVTWLLFTYIQSATAEERIARANTVLGYLHDPEGGKDTVSFVLDMRRDRPYRVWCKEVVSVTKEVFWIFLHHLNVISLPGGKSKPAAISRDSEKGTCPPPPPAHAHSGTSGGSYMLRHFPKERPPVPAAPYVGGVEWEATNYLASHLDLVNAILACQPTAAERNKLRAQMQMSGWERCMGGSLRLCKEKFYGAVHDGLRTWVAAAHEDGWDVRDVRYGPPPPTEAKKTLPAVGGPLAEAPAPKIEMPALDFDLEGL